ncbi:MAG: KpsF/GutQ family sugar-phosphate isomerase [Candidatus Omnitrophica bacterium]|nr:KpsF/GutQ family sugar-phosphate isomerase [Candidatus Omnitrophota bacterium]
MKKSRLKTARQVLDIEARAIFGLKKRIGKDFVAAVDLMVKSKGRVIVSGMGKPGFIAGKIAATLASTGTPSFFLHPAEAVHGDLGMVTDKDVMIAISQSGETEEITRMMGVLKKIGVPIIAMTSNPKSTLAKYADVVLNLGVTKEACPLNLAPSASTTASLAMGDALALALLKEKGFRSEDFAMLHPGGSLGKKLLKVCDLMRTGKKNPVVKSNKTVRQALFTITQARAGSCTIVNKTGKLVGIFTDGDLRRHLREEGEGILNRSVKSVATLMPLVVQKDNLAAEALHLMKSKKIDEVPVVDEKKRVVGLLDVQDLLKAGFV